MKAREERILADRKLARCGAQLEQILAACWEETLDAGPYDFGEQPIDWGEVLQGDRFFTLLRVRVLSYVPDYAFSVPCENRDGFGGSEPVIRSSPRVDTPPIRIEVDARTTQPGDLSELAASAVLSRPSTPRSTNVNGTV